MAGWVEIAPDVFRRRYEPMDVSVSVVRGDAGLLIIDTRSSHREEWREIVITPPTVLVGDAMTLDLGNERLRASLSDGDQLAPGHGAVVDAAFAAAQQEQLQAVADVICELYRTGVPVDAAVQEGGDRWPFPASGMSGALRDGYSQLATTARKDGA